MAVGDDAKAVGWQLVPSTGVGGEVKTGYLEINRTRDYAAQVMGMITLPWPVSKGGTGGTNPATARAGLELQGKITISTAAPSGGSAGDIWLKYTA